MNCWEVIYFVAFKLGIMSKEQIKKNYPSKTSQGSPDGLGYGNKELFYSTTKGDALTGSMPVAGDIAILDHGTEVNHHVVLCVGQINGELQVMSLWSQMTGGTFDLAPLSFITKVSWTEGLRCWKTSPF
jgi:hypothetical protein